MSIRSIIALLVLFILSGCELVPGRGPLSWEVTQRGARSSTGEANYHVITVTEEVITRLITGGEPSLNQRFGNRQPPPIQTISVGDTLSITIFESAPNGLFHNGSPGELTGARQVVLPTQVVDQDGFIDVPFGGRFKAAGKSQKALARMIEQALSDRAIEPQVLINQVESTLNTATVLGEASNTGQVKLSSRGDRLLSVLAKAGIQAPEANAVIRLIRNNQTETVPLRTVINVPSENIYVLPQDTLFVLNEPQVFNALGAVQKPGQYPITFEDQTIAGAVSMAGGLSETIANRGGVFLFRFESEGVAKRFLPSNAAIKTTPAGVPVVYQFSFLDPNSFFWLQQVKIRNNDLIYVANTLVSELDKFIQIAARGRLLGL